MGKKWKFPWPKKQINNQTTVSDLSIESSIRVSTEPKVEKKVDDPIDYELQQKISTLTELLKQSESMSGFNQQEFMRIFPDLFKNNKVLSLCNRELLCNILSYLRKYSKYGCLSWSQACNRYFPHPNSDYSDNKRKEEFLLYLKNVSVITKLISRPATIIDYQDWFLGYLQNRENPTHLCEKPMSSMIDQENWIVATGDMYLDPLYNKEEVNLIVPVGVKIFYVNTCTFGNSHIFSMDGFKAIHSNDNKPYIPIYPDMVNIDSVFNDTVQAMREIVKKSLIFFEPMWPHKL